MFARLQEIGTVAGTVERHLTLFAAALRADASMDGGAEAFLFSHVADGAGQSVFLEAHYFIVHFAQVYREDVEDAERKHLEIIVLRALCLSAVALGLVEYKLHRS
jgi:hypothetical protein